MTEHSYGWVKQQPDFRDLHYAASPAVVKALPPAVDLSLPILPAPFSLAWSQGQLGSCGPHSSSADIVFSALRQDSLAVCPMPSRLFVYWCARKLMGTVNQDSGVDNRSMLKALNQYGWCDETLWPYVPNAYRSQPTQQCFDQAAGRKIVAYLAVPQSLEQMKGALASGDPFIYGFTVYSSMETQSVSQTGIVPMPSRADAVLGGHDVLIVGYDDSTRRFKFRNSWGTDWGDGGYGYMPYEYAVNPQLSGDFWTVQHSSLKPPPVPPAPGPTVYRVTLESASPITVAK